MENYLDRFSQELHGHTDENTAYLVNDYPYGFRLRTQIRYWIETKKGYGQRFVSQTMNPKIGSWNKPKKGIYSIVLGMFLNKENHVDCIGLSTWGWSKEEDILKFESCFKNLDEYQRKAIKHIRATNEASKVIKYEIKPGGTQSYKEQKQKEMEVFKYALSYGYKVVNDRVDENRVV